MDAYERAFTFGLEDQRILDRSIELRQYILHGHPSPSRPYPGMVDFDIRTATYEAHELDRHGPINDAGLRLGDDSNVENTDERGTEATRTASE